MIANALKKLDILNLAGLFAFLGDLWDEPVDTIVGLFKSKPSKGTYVPPKPSEPDIDKEELIDEEVCGLANLQELADDSVVEKIIAGDYDDIDPGEVYDILHVDNDLDVPKTQLEGVKLYRECTTWTLEECKNFYRGHVIS